ncbi:MAG: glycogen debranching enzyme GlgX, partial [Chloroflexota bacterium]
ASVNFITAHDGFTLRDLVSYESKRNEANGEDNRDGENYNESMNFGVEGETDDAAILAARAQQQRNLLATLMLSQGVPMLLGGDEQGRTQRGNNNGYAQDNEISWFDWSLTDADRELLDFTKALIRLFMAHPVLHRRRFFQGRRIRGSSVKDLTWYAPDGREMTDEQWHADGVRTLGLRLAGDAIGEVGLRGEQITDDTLLLIFNANREPADFRLPNHARQPWQILVDTTSSTIGDAERTIAGGRSYAVGPRSVVVLCMPRDGSGEAERREPGEMPVTRDASR